MLLAQGNEIFPTALFSTSSEVVAFSDLLSSLKAVDGCSPTKSDCNSLGEDVFIGGL
jgi:hypothetical protein